MSKLKFKYTRKYLQDTTSLEENLQKLQKVFIYVNLFFITSPTINQSKLYIVTTLIPNFNLVH